MKRIKNWMFVVISGFLLSACNDTSDSTYSDKTTEAKTTVTPDPNAAPTTTVYNPPDNVRTAFQTKYPNASSVTWSPYKTYDRINWEWTGWPSMDTSYYAVNYTVDNRPYWGWWDRNMNWIGSTASIDSTMLPDAVKNTLKKSYRGYTITSIDEENDKNRTAYEIKLEKGTTRARVLIDKDGNIMKKKEENS